MPASLSKAVPILVDADACPVKEELYRTAYALDVPVRIVSNSPRRVPDHSPVARVVVDVRFGAADWAAKRVSAAVVGPTTRSASLRAGISPLSYRGIDGENCGY